MVGSLPGTILHSPPGRSFLSVACQEPFRLFFPLAVLVGISGVSLWPLYFSGVHKFYPGIMHARMMSEGVMGGFLLGFLGTAGPRLAGTAPLSRPELLALVVFYGGAIGAHIAERYFFGDLLFLILLLIFALQMGWRSWGRGKAFAAELILPGFGWGMAFLGTSLLLIGDVDEALARYAPVGGALLYQGFALALIPGFLHGMLPPAIQPDRLRKRCACLSGALLAGSFLLEPVAPWVSGSVRLLSFLLVPGLELARSRARVALAFIFAGLLGILFWPVQRLAAEHLIFMGGFTLVIFLLGLRAFSMALLPRGVTGLLIFGAALRVIGDVLPGLRGMLLSGASYAWMLAATLWLWRAWPLLKGTAQSAATLPSLK